ncbi:MAG: hypothetical protein KAJ62_07260 [Desulfobacteraceae bacterium]|nr:hypothetical protein [Desulfobacteraceae bacterium]
MNQQEREHAMAKLSARCFIVLLLFFLFFFPLSLNAADRNINYEDVDLEKLRIFTYTKYFAKRFGLPAPDMDNLPLDGIEAIEFTLEKPSPKSKVANKYFSMLRIYLKNDINIEFPGDCDAGDSKITTPNNHFFGRTHEIIMKWTSDDRKFFGKSESRYHMSAFYTTPDFGKHDSKGFQSSIRYVEYCKNIFQGISYIKLDTGLYTLKSPSRWPIVIGMKREGGSDYTDIRRSNFDLSEFIIFRLPKPFYIEMYKATQVAIKENKSKKYWKK